MIKTVSLAELKTNDRPYLLIRARRPSRSLPRRRLPHQPGRTGPGPASQYPLRPRSPGHAGPGRLNFAGASLTEVIDMLAKELKLNYVLDASIVKGGTVTINTYGEVRDLDLRQLLETILRMNNLAMVQVGNLYRIVPAGNCGTSADEPVTQSDASKFPDDEQLVLNLVFLRYMTAAEM